MLWRVETSVTFPPLPPAAPIGSVHPTTCRSRSPVRLIRHSVRALGCALFLLATGRAPAQGGPPLVTDDPGTPGRGNWEVNVAATLDRTSLASSWGTPLVDANYGWGERVQLKLEMPFAVVSGADGTRGGIGNPLFGAAGGGGEGGRPRAREGRGRPRLREPRRGGLGVGHRARPFLRQRRGA